MELSSSKNTPSREILPLTGLRFPLTLAVLLGHFSGMEGLRPTGGNRIPLFFVLSGFVMACAYFPHARGEVTTFAFCRKRFARFYPLHIITTFLCAYWFLVDGVLPHWHAGHVGPAFFRSALFSFGAAILPPLYLVPLEGFHTVPNSYAWFVMVELSAGLLFPLAVRTLNRLSTYGLLASILVLPVLPNVLIFFIGFLPTIPIRYVGTINFGTSPLVYLPILLFGASVYRLGSRFRLSSHLKYWSGPVAAALVPLTLLAIFRGFTLPSEQVVLYYFFGVTLLALNFQTGSGSRLLSIPPLLYLGRRSFSIYMISRPVFLTTSAIFGQDHPLVKRESPIWLTLALLLTVLAGILVYRYVEVPATRWLSLHLSRRELAPHDAPVTPNVLSLPPNSSPSLS